ncbi:MAG: aminopeptidase [Anaerolineae bacterium]|jgi:leucyl aminopeptidase (aminopeptidase T)|nr:aminopeptidase [Anaerolineae bacterium]
MPRESKLTLNQIEAMRPGARTAVRTCMGVKPSDRVFVLTDRVTSAIGRLLSEEAAEAGAQATVREIEQIGPRPMTELGGDLRRELEAFRPSVTFYAAASQPGELPFRMALRVFLTQELMVRHGHMPGVTPQLMVEGMRADYKVVAALTRAVYDLGREAREIRVTTPDGTDLLAQMSPRLRWVPSTGIYHEQGQWGNLPEGETFTCPHTLEGTLVAHILGDYFSEKYGVLAKPVIFHIADGRVTAVESENADIAFEITEYLDSAENGRRAGEFAIGTNVGLKKLTGNLLQDEKLPGVHVAFGNPYPHETGADWTSKVHVDVIPLNCTIAMDGQVIMRHGRFDYDLLGVSPTGR